MTYEEDKNKEVPLILKVIAIVAFCVIAFYVTMCDSENQNVCVNLCINHSYDNGYVRYLSNSELSSCVCYHNGNYSESVIINLIDYIDED